MNLEIIDDGLVWGYHGFINIRYVEDVIDGGFDMVAEVLYKFDDQVVRTLISLEWFNEFKSKMVIKHPGKYDGVNWKLFKLAMNELVE